MKYSIVIPTFNHCDDLLKPCIESIQKFSSMENVELVIVANGCRDNTLDFVHSLTHLNVIIIWEPGALGYTKATNLGIQQATGDYIVLMNNDLVLLDQPKDQWLDMLQSPFNSGNTGVTGPVKFDWVCGSNTYECMAFWLVMMKRELFSQIGLLDEIYSPGMGEDGDFCIRAMNAGYSLVSVPQDIKGHFDTGIVNQQFPIYHVGNGTFADDNIEKNAVIERNNIILASKYGKKINVTITIPTYNHFEDAFKPCIDAVLAYTDLSDKEIIVVANGCTDGTRAYLDSLSDRVKYIWFDEPQGVVVAYNAAIKAARGDLLITIDNDSILQPQAVDSWVNILKKPFADPSVGASSPFANDYVDMGLVLHAGCTMYRTELMRQVGMFDEIYNPGYFCDSDMSMKIWGAGYQCVEVPEYAPNKLYTGTVFQINFPVVHTGTIQTMDKHTDNAIVAKNRKILYARYGKKKYSIVIPTYNHCDDLLKPCIDSIKEFTDLSNVEIIVVANGCVDNTRQYLENSDIPIKVVWFDEGIGYTRATNEGIKVSTGEYIILLNNDTQFLGQHRNDWINRLQGPFADTEVGVTGVLELHDHSADADFLVFFCVMIHRRVFTKIGGLDEIFSPGYGEDIDFCIRAKRAGFKCVGVDPIVHEGDRSYTTFPIWHKNNQTFGEIPEYGSEIVVRNSNVLKQRYGKKMKKYSIVIPTYNHCEDLLRPLCESMMKYTDMSLLEVIIVANGCKDNTREYVESLGEPFKLIWSEEAIGYTKATNLGIKECTGEYVVLLNNDTELLPQTQNQWLNMMVEKFADPKVGMVGPLELFDTYSNNHVLIFFCVMIRKSVFDEIGILDEIYSPGGGEDIDFTIRVKKAGYKSVAIASSFSPEVSTNVGNVPIWHKDNQTFKDIPEYSKVVIKQNGLLNCRRYNDNLKLNIGAGGIDYPGFLSVDLYDKRALIKMDITKLDFADNSATELMASHVFEHLNPYHSVDILTDWLRVLKPGGKLSMEMPDIEKCCRSFLENKDYYARMGVANVIYGSVNTTGEGGPDNITAPHLFGWWPESMFNHLMAAGYVDISFPSEKWPHPGDNFRVEAYKPALKIDHASLQTQEPMTYKELFEENSYGVETIDVRGKQVIDIGGNLGMFSLLCVERGASRIICVEAQPVIYNLGLLNNVKQYPMITPLNYAASGVDGEWVHIFNEHVGSKVGGDVGDLVETITLKTLMSWQNVLGDDLVLKLDCEGSEFNVIMEADVTTMRKFAVIYMELHGNTNPNPAYANVKLVEDKLVEFGFTKVKEGEIVHFNDDHSRSHGLGVYVQKWVRV